MASWIEDFHEGAREAEAALTVIANNAHRLRAVGLDKVADEIFGALVAVQDEINAMRSAVYRDTREQVAAVQRDIALTLRTLLGFQEDDTGS